MGPKERREREREQIREKILDAARELFATEGYEAVSMRKIAKKIEYSPTAIYLHFPDKESLIHELCDTDFLALAMDFRRIAKIEDPIDRLRQTGRAYAKFGLQHPNHYRTMFMSPLPPMDIEKSRVEKGNPEVDAYAFLRAIVRECMEKGLFRNDARDVELVTQTMWAVVHGVVALAITHKSDPWVPWRAIRRRVDFAIDNAIRGLRGEP